MPITNTRSFQPRLRVLVGAVALMFAGGNAFALTYDGPANQFAGGFSPSNAPYGGFGGGNCSASKTPVIYVHGNGDHANNWDKPPSPAAQNAGITESPYEHFISQGYNDCELFGITYLSSSQQGPDNVHLNFISPDNYNMVATFIDDVRAYTGSAKVDIIAHSMGNSVAFEAVERNGKWGQVRRFVNLAGGLRGLASCWWFGVQDPQSHPFPTCSGPGYQYDYYGENITGDKGFKEYGFIGHRYRWWSAWWSQYKFAINPRMADPHWLNNYYTGGENYQHYYQKRNENGEWEVIYTNASMPQGLSTYFYTISADKNDQIYCTGAGDYYPKCAKAGKFHKDMSNVRAEINVGQGATPDEWFEWAYRKWWHGMSEIWGDGSDGGDDGTAPNAGDALSGVGHLRAKSDTGQIQYQMLNSNCTGTACIGNYPRTAGIYTDLSY